MHCIFCQDIKETEKIFVTPDFFGVFDLNPEQAGHLLIISRRHVMKLTDLNPQEVAAFFPLVQKCVAILERNFPVLGTTVVMNNGGVMDEGVHFHAHLIPRYANDQFWQGRVVQQHALAVAKWRQLLSELS